MQDPMNQGFLLNSFNAEDVNTEAQANSIGSTDKRSILSSETARKEAQYP